MPASRPDTSPFADVEASIGVGVSPHRRSLTKLKHRFRQSGYGDLQGIRVQMRGRFVHLMGEVPSFHMKQVAQEMVRHDLPGHRVVNELSVGDTRPSPRRRDDFRVVRQPR